MKNLKVFFLSLILFAIALLSSANFSIFADSNSTIIYPVFNELSGEYLNLENIDLFDIHGNTLVYSTINNNQSTIHFYNLKSHTHTKTIENKPSVKFLKLTKNYLFMLIEGRITILSLDSFTEVNSTISNYENITSIDISEQNNQITICIIKENKLTRIYLKSDLTIIDSKTSESKISNMVGEVAITQDYAYVIHGDMNLNRIVKIDLSSLNISENNYSYFPLENCTKLAHYKHGDQNYLILTSQYNDNSKVGIVRDNLIKGEAEEFQAGGGTKNDNNIYDLGTLVYPTDIKIINNKIYISDRGTKTIQTYDIQLDTSETPKAKLRALSVFVASEFAENGYFSKSTDIAYHNNTIVFADKINNRVETITNGILQSKSESGEFFPQNVEINNGTIFYTFKQTKNSVNPLFAIFDGESKNVYDRIIINNESHYIPEIYSSTLKGNVYYALTQNNIIYFDYVSNKFKCVQSPFSNLRSFDESSIINYNEKLDIFLIYNNSTLYLLNSDFSLESSKNDINNLIDFCSCNNKIFTLQSNGTISKYNISFENEISLEKTISNKNFNNYSKLAINKETGLLYAFNSELCSIETIVNCEFNLLRTFNKIITINKNVTVYKKPCVLPSSQENIYTKITSISTLLDLYNTQEISYGGNVFYAIIINSNIYYVNINDVDLYSSEQIVYYKAPNASIRNGNKKVEVYESPDLSSKVIHTLYSGSKFITENYNENSKFTKIKFYNEYNQLTDGYIETDVINPFNLSKSAIIAIVLLCVSLAFVVILLVIYFKIYRNKK